MSNYTILRFYREDGRPAKVIATGLSKEEAVEHCSDPKTRKEGEWFDGWTKEAQ